MACNNEENDTLSPSGLEPEWFAIQDNPNNELDHLIYTVYQTYGASIFYKDTIWLDNNRFTPLNADYEITIKKNVTYAKSHDEKELSACVSFMRDLVVSKFDGDALPLSYLLVDTCWDNKVIVDVYKGLRTTIVSNAQKIGKMTPSEQKEFAAKVIAKDLSYYLFEHCDEALQPFYKITYDVYGKDIYAMYLSKYTEPTNTTPFEDFSMITGTGCESGYTPSQLQDLEMFVSKIFLDDPAFETTYGDYPPILKKFRLIKELVKKYRK